MSAAPNSAPLVRRYSLNTAGRDLLVGDIHGHFFRLQAALDAVAFDPARDRLFSVGDLVDRGPDSDQALEWLARPWFHAVSGNHEDMAVCFAAGAMDGGHYMGNGGGWNIGNPPELRREFAEAFAALPVALELETADGPLGIVHACCPCACWQDFTQALETGLVRRADGSISQNPAEVAHLIDMARWRHTDIYSHHPGKVEGVRAVVVGHTPMERITSLGNTLYIDTGAWRQDARNPFVLVDAKTLREASKPSPLQW